ncbi:MAG: RNA polymerase sigma factor [marine bacterium B5-7]|nr:MAG: RNA polymerase sigma factor [marine bacterium B5-7]
MTDHESDNELIARIADGNEGAMTSFYQAHESRVYAFALRKLNDPHAAADIVIETMMAVWNGAGSFKGQAKVTTWLFGIAHRKSIDALRKRGRHMAEELDFDIVDDSADFTAALEASENSDRLRQCLDGLSEAHKEVVHLAFFEDLSYPEIATIVECPEGTVKTRVFHAKKMLRQCLERLKRG